MKKQTPKLSRFTKQIVNRKYDLGQCDCFSLILDYLKFQQVDYPDSFKEVTRETYPDLFKSDPDQAKSLMVEFINELLDEKKRAFRSPGDVLLIRLKNSDSLSLAIDGGNSTAVCVSQELGVMVASIEFYDVLRCWSIK